MFRTRKDRDDDDGEDAVASSEHNTSQIPIPAPISTISVGNVVKCAYMNEKVKKNTAKSAWRLLIAPPTPAIAATTPNNSARQFESFRFHMMISELNTAHDNMNGVQ
ncbi:MAG: hypothetical protein FJX20_07920 [Alphaproteobacteria bacterium]|nr:hypothetical protein [Alphaproteobacteria bacterium]